MNLYRSLAPCMVLMASACSMQTAFGQAANQNDQALTVQEAEYLAESQAKWQSLSPRSGKIELPGGFATLNVPEQYAYLGPTDAASVLEHNWGTGPGKKTLGMLMSRRHSPFDYASWAVTIEYVHNGYVSDAKASAINYDKLLKKMQAQTRLDSESRAQAGFGTVELLGWAEPPHYSSSDKHMYWARELLFNEDERVLSYEMRTLGRQGMLSMIFNAAPDQLAGIAQARDDILAMVSFNEGFRYADFNPATDTLASYGLDTLVAGAAAEKSSLRTSLPMFLLKMGIVILVIAGVLLTIAKQRLAGYEVIKA